MPSALLAAPAHLLRPVAVPAEPSAPARPSAALPTPAASTVAWRRPAARRRRLSLFSFAALVVLPAFMAAAYLFLWAQDQFHSRLAFSVRSEGAAIPVDMGLLGAVGGLAAGGGQDAEILFDFIGSEAMVAAAHRGLDLHAVFRPDAPDPVFALAPDAPVEDMADYWRRMVRVRLDAATGILDVEVRAFRPGDAQAVAALILAESEALVNRLSDEAQRDAIRFAGADLREAEARLRRTRQDLARFRDDNSMVDPQADIAGQMGLLNALQGEQAQAQIERDMLLTYASKDDQRVMKIDRRLDAVTARIAAERQKLGLGGDTRAMAALLGRYEELRTDLEFAAGAYTQALANHAAATAEARRKSRYLAAHVRPTLAETAIYPRRVVLAGLVLVGLTLAWGVGMVACYTIRDAA